MTAAEEDLIAGYADVRLRVSAVEAAWSPPPEDDPDAAWRAGTASLWHQIDGLAARIEQGTP